MLGESAVNYTILALPLDFEWTSTSDEYRNKPQSLNFFGQGRVPVGGDTPASRAHEPKGAGTHVPARFSQTVDLCEWDAAFVAGAKLIAQR